APRASRARIPGAPRRGPSPRARSPGASRPLPPSTAVRSRSSFQGAAPARSSPAAPARRARSRTEPGCRARIGISSKPPFFQRGDGEDRRNRQYQERFGLGANPVDFSVLARRFLGGTHQAAAQTKEETDGIPSQTDPAGLPHRDPVPDRARRRARDRLLQE